MLYSLLENIFVAAAAQAIHRKMENRSKYRPTKAIMPARLFNIVMADLHLNSILLLSLHILLMYFVSTIHTTITVPIFPRWFPSWFDEGDKERIAKLQR